MDINEIILDTISSSNVVLMADNKPDNGPTPIQTYINRLYILFDLTDS